MAEKNKLTIEQQNMIETAKKIVAYKMPVEANVVSIIYKNPNLIYESNLTPEDFSTNSWKVYFIIAYEILINENKNILDDITVGIYLEKHGKLKKKYEEYGGYDTIKQAMAYVATENFEGYVAELRKWKSVLKLCKEGFPINNKLHEFTDMSAEDIYAEYEIALNSVFINIDSDSKAYDICDGIDNLIDELDKGLNQGLPYYNLPLLNSTTGGQRKGDITLIGGLSNVGKSTFVRTTTLPSIINSQNKLLIMLNEEGKQKWQREMLVWIANNIFHFDIQKHTVRDGSYTDEVKSILRKSAEWLKEQTKNHIITLIPFQRYTTAKAIKVIKKYQKLGVENFILDTYKMDAGNNNEQSWIQMQQSMVDINDIIKAENLNLNIVATFQLNKGSAKQRYYTQDNIGMAKNIVDPASTCIMIRNMFEDEFDGEKHAIKVYRLEGANKNTKVEVKLDRSKKYQIVFIVKNREGSANDRQIVIEHDLSRNIMKEVGVTSIKPDF